MNINNENFSSDSGDEGDDASGSGDPSWLEACRREKAIRNLLNRSDGDRLKLSDVADVALELGSVGPHSIVSSWHIGRRRPSKRSNRNKEGAGRAYSFSIRPVTI